jgi:hypothetical protein
VPAWRTGSIGDDTEEDEDHADEDHEVTAVSAGSSPSSHVVGGRHQHQRAEVEQQSGRDDRETDPDKDGERANVVHRLHL